MAFHGHRGVVAGDVRLEEHLQRGDARTAPGTLCHDSDPRSGSLPPAGGYCITSPPSTWMVWPVMYAAASEARNATVGAISSGLA